MTKIVRLGSRLRYPITVVRLLKAPGDKIRKQESLMEYSFKWTREVGDSTRGETWQEEVTTIVTWDSPADGEVTRWLIREGQHIVADKGVMEVKEECSHEVQFQGLCGMCGKDMTEVNWAAETRDTARAPINMVHDQTNLTVSANQAQRTEQEQQRRLLQSRKLSLVVDLDQTIIQACIDPTVGEWQKDPTNPNHESVKDVQSFQLDDGPTDLARRCSYYIKMRPGLKEFLKRISEMYELHVYTMGTRAYAQNVARVVDPDKKLFGNRLISRDENGNIFAKSLQRLFPVSTRMVVIIDDRSDVWPRNRPNLIKVSPYEFFKGIGDINSSYLPKRQDLLTSDATTNGAAEKKKAPSLKANKTDLIAAQATVNPTAEDDPVLIKQQAEEQKRTFEKQIIERPLQALQEKLDREDEEAEKGTVVSDDSSDSRSSSPPSQRHHVLQDDDEELRYLEQHLAALHRQYYAEYDSNRASHNGAGAGAIDLTSVPDAGRILDELKAQVLQGRKIVLSGVLPRGTDIYRSEIGLQILSFGAELRQKVGRDVTHLVVNAAQPGRDKLLDARRRPRIKIVRLEWLATCFSQWAAVDEGPYLFTARLVGEDEAGAAGNQLPVVSDEDEDDGENKAPNGHAKPVLKLVSAMGTSRELLVDEGNHSDEDDIEPGLLPDDIPDGQASPIDGLKTFNWGSADEELAEFLADISSDEDGDGDGDGDDDDDEEVDDEKDEDYVAPPNEAGEVESTSSSDDARGRAARRSRTASPSAAANRKRKSRDEGDEEGQEGGDAEAAGNGSGEDAGGTPAKRLRRIESQRGSSLRNLYAAGAAAGDVEKGEGENGLPTPGVSDAQDMEGVEAQQNGDRGDEEGAGGDGDDDDEDMDFDLAELEAEFEAEFDKAEAEFSVEEAGEQTEKG